MSIAKEIVGAAGGGLLGGVKSLLDMGKEKRQSRIQAMTTAMHPWTGLNAAAPEEANPLGDVLQGAAQGAAFGQGLESRKAGTVWDDLARKRYETETSLLEKQLNSPYLPGFGYTPD